MKSELKLALGGLGSAALLMTSILAVAQTATGTYTGLLSTNYIPHTVANQYLAVAMGEIGTQTIVYRDGTTTNIDLKGKWSAVATGGDPDVLASSNQDLSLLGSDPGTGQIGGGSNMMVALVDAPLIAPTGRIPGYLDRYLHDGGLGGGNTTVTGPNGTTTASTSTTGTNTNCNSGNTNNTTNSTNNTNNTNCTNEHAVEFGQGGFLTPTTTTTNNTNNTNNNNNNNTGPLSPLLAQYPTEHDTSKTVTSVWIDPMSDVAFVCFLTLLRDTVRVQYSAINEDIQSHTVGMLVQVQPNNINSRIVNDPVLSQTTNPNGDVYIPGQGLQGTEVRYDQPLVPNQILTYDALPNYNVYTRMILNGLKDIKAPPDHLILGSWLNVGDCCSDNYVYQYDPSQTIADPISWGFGADLYWDPQTLQPQQSRTVVTYYGLGGASEDFTLPYVQASEAPPALSYNQITNTTTGNSMYTYGPDPFPIKGFIYNASGFSTNSNPATMLQNLEGFAVPIQAPTSTVALAPGLSLAGGQNVTQNLADIPNETDGVATWLAMPLPGAAGAEPFTVTGGGSPFGSKSVSNSIEVPALPSGVNFGSGWQMVTFPFTFSGLSFGDVLPVLNTGQAFLARWDPGDNTYHFYDPNVPDSFVQTVTPGQAYWLYVTPAAVALNPFSLPTIATPYPLSISNTGAGGGATGTTTPNRVSVPLQKGWNQVGDPFVYSAQYPEVYVYYNGQQYSIKNAVLQGLITTSNLYGYTSGASQYTVLQPVAGTELSPLAGYWIDAQVSGAMLLFSAPALPDAQIVSTITAGPGLSVRG